jgi:hypothetical protein
MSAAQRPDTQESLDRAGTGDRTARQELLARHRGRLRQMVALRIDRRMAAARVDPSDVVQEALADAAQSLSDYLRDRPLPFYPWLRQFAWGTRSRAEGHDGSGVSQVRQAESRFSQNRARGRLVGRVGVVGPTRGTRQSVRMSRRRLRQRLRRTIR